MSELLLVALTVSGIVKAVCSAINSAHSTYRNIQKGSIELELSKINLANEQLELTQRQIRFCDSSSKSLVKLFGLSEEQDQQLNERVQGNPVMKLKILLSVFRRVEPLAKQQVEGKIEVTGKESDGI